MCTFLCELGGLEPTGLGLREDCVRPGLEEAGR